MTIPTRDHICLPLLKVISDAGGELSMTEAIRRIEAFFPDLTKADRLDKMPSGGRRWPNRVQWARQRLVLQNFLYRQPKGVWRITPEGRTHLENNWREQVGPAPQRKPPEPPQDNAAVPTYDELLWPTLQALQALGGSGTIQEIESKVAEIMGLTDAQLSVLHTGNPRGEVSYRLAWARTYLKKVGAIENSSRAVWAITDKGHRLSETDTARIPAQVRRMKGRANQTGEPEPQTNAVTTDPDGAGADYVWHDRLLETLQAIRPDAFERLCQRFLREAGFTRVEVTGRSGDGGIDGVGVLRMSLLSFRVLFQSKRVRGSVGPSVVRDFRGAMVGRADKGIIITTGTFTPEARREATRDGATPIELIDGTELCEALRQYNLGVSTIEVVQVDTAWFDAL